MRGQLAHGTRGLAGKIHALLSREHTKGRDLFDEDPHDEVLLDRAMLLRELKRPV